MTDEAQHPAHRMYQRVRKELEKLTWAKALMYHGLVVFVLSPGAFLYDTAPVLWYEMEPLNAFSYYLAIGAVFLAAGCLGSRGDDT